MNVETRILNLWYINEMLKWADKWQLECHPDKSVKMSINKKDEGSRTHQMNENFT